VYYLPGVPTSTTLSTYFPTRTYTVNYGDCEYLPDFAPYGGPAPGQPFSVAARLEFPVQVPVQAPTELRYFLTATPISTNAVSEGRGLNDRGESFLTYSVNQTIRSIPTQSINSLYDKNPEIENQNIFIASPLKSNPYDLTAGFRIESLMPPFSVVSPQMISPVLEVPSSASNTSIVLPTRLFLANFAPGHSGVTNGDTYNTPTPYLGSIDGVIVGGGAPNYYWDTSLRVTNMQFSRQAQSYYVIPGGSLADIVASPGINLASYSSGSVMFSGLGYGAFSPMIQLDLSVSTFDEDPGFYVMLCAGSDYSSSGQVAQPWWIHSNYPPWSVNLYTVYGLGTPNFPFRSKVFTFSYTQQKQIKSFQLFMNNAITFAQKNGLSLNIFTSTQFTQMGSFLPFSSAPAVSSANFPLIGTILSIASMLMIALF
jgi:hypothetical protein